MKMCISLHLFLIVLEDDKFISSHMLFMRIHAITQIAHATYVATEGAGVTKADCDARDCTTGVREADAGA
jgi:hypothetical protein